MSAILVSVLLELPVPVVEGADLPGLQPAGDAVEVEGVVTHPPGNRALLAGGTCLEAAKIIHPAKDVVSQCFSQLRLCAHLVGLALYAEVHDVVAADGTVLHLDIPRPQSAGIPPLHLEPDTGVQLGRGGVLLLLMVTLLHTHTHDRL